MYQGGKGLKGHLIPIFVFALLLFGALIALLAVRAPGALAAAPANDNFASAETLSGSLPIEVSRSNVEATREPPLENVGTFAAGHSVWFKWEATSTEVVTVGSCEADFHTVLGVFTGASLNSLTPVASGNSSEGPHCPFTGSEYTFKATAGTTYEIAVDGSGFYVQPPPPPSEGEFTLRIEATPSPANDDFANATTLAGQTSEEPEGNRFYYASTNGYNWKATTEAGEPSHGPGSGASVWYTWTAPESGTYHFNGLCCGGGLGWGLYIGSSIGELTPFLVGGGSAEVTVLAGTIYRIGVYGTPDLGTGEPSVGSFSFSISANLPPLPPPPSSAAVVARPSLPGTTLPDTTILKRVLKRRPPIYVFSLHSSEPGSTFRCKLDKHPVATCPASERFGNLKPGRHVLTVVAVDAGGNEDPTPAVVRFTVPGSSKHPRSLRHR
jgi:hypothetical protein